MRQPLLFGSDVFQIRFGIPPPAAKLDIPPQKEYDYIGLVSREYRLYQEVTMKKNSRRKWVYCILNGIRDRRRALFALSAIVVFITTYALILPALTLDEETAGEQGGIDTPAAVQTTEPDGQDPAKAEASDDQDAVSDNLKTESPGTKDEAEARADSGKDAEAKPEEESGAESEKEPGETSEIQDGRSDQTQAEDQTEAASNAAQPATQLEFTGNGYGITLRCEEAAALPEDTQLTAQQIGKKHPDYEAYLQETEDAFQKEEPGSKKKISFVRFYDISLMAGDQEIEPADNVNVTISYDKALKVADADDIRIVHFGADRKGVLQPEILDDEDVEAEVRNGKMTETSFEAESFSVYGVVYTVDFHYDVNGETFDYSIEGESSILLSQLFEKLRIDVDIADVADVTFTDDSLLEITREKDSKDWKLRSLKPFRTEETLTVKLVNGDQFEIRVTDFVQGAYGQSINIDIFGDGSITLGEYVHPYDWDWWGTYDHEERNTYYSYRTLDLSVRYGSNTNNQDIVANPAAGYEFDHWELQDGSSHGVTTITSAVISAGSAAFSPGSTLTAVFRKSSGGGGGGFDFNDVIQEWIEKITKDQPVVDKTAAVYDYANRIYKVDVSASSQLYAVNQNLDIDFVTDVSGSMLFPSKLEAVATFNNATDIFTQLDNAVRQNHHGNLPASTAAGELYYINLDPQGASNVFVVRRYNGQWWCLAAAYTEEEINAPTIPWGNNSHWRQLNVRDNNGNVEYTNFSTQNIIEKKIYMATDSTKRLDYLQQALYIARDVLYKVNPDAKIGLTTFAANANQGRFYSGSERDALSAAIRDIATEGGTNQADGLAKGKALLDSDPDNTRKKVAILITDGAPNGCTWDQIKANAQSMKNAGIDVYTVGLSVENVQGASQGLYETSNGYGYAFDAKDGRGLVEAIESIINSLTTKANLTGTVSDVIDPAFYPVAEDGTPLQPGVEYEDENGHKYTLAKNGEEWTVTWADQSIGWAYTDMQGEQPGWKGTVYVKAKENFLGGNAIKTNSNTDNDNVTVTGFKTFTYNDDDEEVVLNSGPLKDEDGQPKTISKKLETPYVNVDELALTGNNTEWTVYLGTEVDPKSELKELLKKVDIQKVVSGDTNEMITSKSQMLGGTGASSKTISLTDYLGLTSDSQIDALINDLLTNGSKTYNYNDSFASAYGHGYVGDIKLSLVNTSGCWNKGNHATEATGKDAEFTLKVEYLPRTNAERNGELNITEDKYHTTPGGSAGEPVPKTGNDMTSTNHHVINAYAKGFRITKKDQTFETELTGAEFKLYRTARDGETTGIKTIDGEDYVPVATLDMSSSSTASVNPLEALRENENYYLVETDAPDGYNVLEDPIPVNLTFTDTYTPKPEGDPASAKPAAGPYDWTQAATLTIGPSGHARMTDQEGNPLTGAGIDASASAETVYFDISNDSGVALPNSGGPGTTWIYILGAVLLLGGSILLIARLRSGKTAA